MSDTLAPAAPGQASPPGPPGPGGVGGVPGGPQAPILAALARSRGNAAPAAPGAGSQAQAMMQVKSAIEIIQNALPNLPVGSQLHRDALTAVNRLSRHMPQGTPTAGVQQNMLMQLLANNRRNALIQRIMAQRGGAGGGGAPGVPSPSTPIPGA